MNHNPLRVLILSTAGFLAWALLVSRADHPRKRPLSVTLNGRLAEFSQAAEARLRPFFDSAKVLYPPEKITLIGLKQEKQLELWASTSAQSGWNLIRSYPILAASGGPGPKMREGDRQVPEGFYRVELLNPNSKYHLSLRLNYPNRHDREKALQENRTKLGGDIMIHGRAVSTGCLALGDPAIEEIFTLAARTGVANINVILSPVDFRKNPEFTPPENSPSWVPDLYRRLAKALDKFKYPISSESSNQN